jgi:sec-independent protein translocase protein TatA
MGLDNPLHILFLLLILLLVFGAKRLPEIGRSLGTGMREFKQSVTGAAAPQASEKVPAQPMLQAAQQPPAEPATAQPTAPEAAPVESSQRG